jgi:predicted RNA-binding Zn-ribbon protein involved in translation (DUF1610 family)
MPGLMSLLNTEERDMTNDCSACYEALPADIAEDAPCPNCGALDGETDVDRAIRAAEEEAEEARKERDEILDRAIEAIRNLPGMGDTFAWSQGWTSGREDAIGAVQKLARS